MRLLLTFFIFICFHLSGELGTVHTNNYYFNNYHASVVHTVKIKTPERTGICQQPLLASHPEIPGENELPLFVEDEDDENHSRKCKSSTVSYSTFYYPFIVSYTCIEQANRLFIRSLASQISSRKYITQRVLRI